jgi:hypothetical protein
MAQVDLMIAFLMDKNHVEYGNALVNFVIVLAEQHREHPPSETSAVLIEAILSWKARGTDTALVLFR